MCALCEVFPAPAYMAEVAAIFEHKPKNSTEAHTLRVAADCLNDWAYIVGRDPSDTNIYALIQARDLANTRYKAATGKDLPLQ